jgi:D-alanine-D-alanine ligase
MVSAPRELPADLAPELADQLRRAARRIAALVGLRGIARLDFLSDGEALFVNEINTVPGSLAKYLWVEPAVPFARLLADMAEEATRRPTVQWTTAGADGAALRSAGTIAGKLGQ